VSVKFDWKVEGDEALLMASLPHHRDGIDGVSYEEAVAFKTLRGDMVGTVGSSWVLLERPTQISWSSPREISSDKVEAIRAALKEDKAFNPGPGNDPYFGGKALAKLARLALIADELGEDAWVQDMVATLKESIEPWVVGKGWSWLD
jgi:endo-1,3(4)-beta-glucanase